MIFEVCVVSSSPALALALDEELRDEGICIEPVTSGAYAIKRASCGCATAVLLDEDPGDMTAAELLRHLSNDDRGRSTLIVVLSQKSSEIDRVIAFELGADDFIAKPIGVRELGLRGASFPVACKLDAG